MSGTGQAGIDLSRAREIIDHLKDKEGSLIQILQEVQEEYGYFPVGAVDVVSDMTGISPVRIYGILTFYAQFKLQPPGRHTIRVCQGTACHVMGGEQILDFLIDKLGVSPGGTTKDGMTTFERVACVGCCGMAPAVIIDGKVFGNSTVRSVEGLIEDLKDGEVDQ